MFPPFVRGGTKGGVMQKKITYYPSGSFRKYRFPSWGLGTSGRVRSENMFPPFLRGGTQGGVMQKKIRYYLSLGLQYIQVPKPGLRNQKRVRSENMFPPFYREWRLRKQFIGYETLTCQETQGRRCDVACGVM